MTSRALVVSEEQRDALETVVERLMESEPAVWAKLHVLIDQWDAPLRPPEVLAHVADTFTEELVGWWIIQMASTLFEFKVREGRFPGLTDKPDGGWRQRELSPEDLAALAVFARRFAKPKDSISEKDLTDAHDVS